MTAPEPQTYWEKRCLILESVARDLMLLLIASNPMSQQHINGIGAAWDRALDKLDIETKEAS